MIEHLEINGSEQFNIAIDVSKVPKGIPLANIAEVCKTIVSETGSLPHYATYIPEKQRANFMRVIEQTHEEKVKMYMKHKKIELVEMLIECNRIIDMMKP